jgi:hypothetical protein
MSGRELRPLDLFLPKSKHTPHPLRHIHQPRAAEVIRHGDRKQNAEPHEPDDHPQLREAGRILHVHEEQDDECRLDAGDNESRHNIEIVEIDEGEHDRQRRAH